MIIEAYVVLVKKQMEPVKTIFFCGVTYPVLAHYAFEIVTFLGNGQGNDIRKHSTLCSTYLNAYFPIWLKSENYRLKARTDDSRRKPCLLAFALSYALRIISSAPGPA